MELLTHKFAMLQAFQEVINCYKDTMKPHLYKTQLLALVFILCGQILATAQTYIEARAQAGDGIQVLLRRYRLDRHSCNFELFYKLNNLQKNSPLFVGKVYKLPITKEIFDGKSIRTSLKMNDWHEAKQVERFNRVMQIFKLKNGDFRTGKRELWLPHHIKNCGSNLEQFVPQSRNFPIFGDKDKDVPLADKKLAGAVYYVVAGHGGADPGAMAKYNGKDICEDEYAYDISLRLARNLLSHGAIVYIITRDKNDGIRDAHHLECDMDEICWEDQAIPVGQKERLTQRSEVINQLYQQHHTQGIDYQCMVEIHVDSRSRSERTDLFFYHHPNDTLGQLLTTDLYKVFKEKYKIHRKSGDYAGTVVARDLHMLRETKPIGVFIEVANIQNKSDQKRIVEPTNRQTLADWLTEGLIEDY